MIVDHVTFHIFHVTFEPVAVIPVLKSAADHEKSVEIYVSPAGIRSDIVMLERGERAQLAFTYLIRYEMMFPAVPVS